MVIVVIVLCVVAVALSLFKISGVMDIINTKGKKKDKSENDNPQK
jgi:hypothetical protein